MWPILIVSIIGVAVVLERVFWWTGRWMRRDPKRIEKVFTAIETRGCDRGFPLVARFARPGFANDVERIESPARLVARRFAGRRWH